MLYAVQKFLRRKEQKIMDWKAINATVDAIDSFVWGPAMLVLLVGTGVYLTFKLNFRTWRNLPYALKSVLGKDARTMFPRSQP